MALRSNQTISDVPVVKCRENNAGKTAQSESVAQAENMTAARIAMNYSVTF